MGRFLPYEPDQAYLVPPSVKDELGEDHLCFFIHRAVEHMDLRSFEQEYSVEGGELYHPALMLKVWLYAYAVGMTSAHRLEQRIREDLGLRYLAGGARPDNWALSAFRRRHARGLNDVFTQVLEMARGMKLGRLGQVAIDATRIQAAASRNRLDTEERLRKERARIRRMIRKWQKLCDEDDPNEGAGTRLHLEKLQEQLQALPRRLEKLRKSGMKKVSRTDEDARFLRERAGFVLGYTAEAAVNEDHLIVGQRVTQNAADNHSLIPLVEEAERQSGRKAEKILADAGFFSLENIEELEARGLEVYVPDSNLARELNTGQRCPRMRLGKTQRRMRQKLRGPTGQAVYRRRKALVEPVWGTLKEQRGMRRFRLRGLQKVKIEFTLAAISFNLTRLLAHRQTGPANVSTIG
jgi:transposase